MKKSSILLLVLILSLSTVFSSALAQTAENYESIELSEAEAQVYKDYSEKKCLNILIAGQNQAPIYNGDVVAIGLVPPLVSDAHIAADSIGYLQIQDSQGSTRKDVIFNGVNYGPTVDTDELAGDSGFVVGDEHFAFVKISSSKTLDNNYEKGSYNLIMDGKDLGQTHYGSFLDLEGTNLLYSKYIGNDSYIFLNNEQKHKGYSAMLDNDDLWVNDGGKIYKNGEFIINVHAGGSYVGDFYAKDGHFAYSKGKHTSLANMYYDNKLLGKGTHPQLEADNYAYLWTPEDDHFEYHFMYNGQDKGIIDFKSNYSNWGNNLAGKHFAFIEKTNAKNIVNIDGINFPGNFPDDTYVEITNKAGCVPEGYVFADVQDTDEFAEAISALKKENVVNGYSDGTYKPDYNINRAEFLKIVVETLYDFNADTYRKACFKDVSPTDWFTPYICFAKKQNIIAGYSDNTFKPGQNINRAEALKIILEAQFNDIQASDGPWYAAYFTYAIDKDLLLNKLSKWVDEPGSLVTRGEMAELAFRVLELN